MSQIHIHREHHLGLAKAREIAWSWAEEVEHKFDMECTVIEGETEDTVTFKRTGVSGSLTVADDHFDLNAKLGFLLGAFAKTIEAEITKNLDALLNQGERLAAKSAKAAKTAAAEPAAPGQPSRSARAKTAAGPAARAAASLGSPAPAAPKAARKPAGRTGG